jgi:Rieske Fe-S protein
MQQLVLKWGKYFILYFVLTLVSSSCDKIVDSPIPEIYVSYTINLNIVNELNVPGNSVFFPNAGYGGLIVYCELPGSWYAFDAACTYEASRNCIVKNDGVLADCPCCGSQFVLISGAYPTKSPATLPLKQYNVSVLNSFSIRVYN